MKRKPDGAPIAPKSKRLEIQERDGMTHDRLMADAAANPAITAAMLVTEYSKGSHVELSLTDEVATLRDKIGAVHGGDLKDAEAMLTAQAVALNSIFTALALRSAANMGQHLEATERYMRLALKAQSQCRATLETLVVIKNPPLVIAKQANVTTGPQQINNGTAAGSCAREIDTEQSKLLEADNGHGWTPERRARQSELIWQWRPWKRSTGPRTDEGKATVSRNAYKGGWREKLKELRRALREQDGQRRKME